MLPLRALLVAALTGSYACGGGGGPGAQMPIAVSLQMPTVTVSQDGATVIVRINITSTSETALVMFTGLPGGVDVKYSASDTNPSGTLAFTANSAATPGTYMPTVTVNSAGQTASTTFTLIITTS